MGPDSRPRLDDDRLPDAEDEERAMLRIAAERLVTAEVTDLDLADLSDDEELVLGRWVSWMLPWPGNTGGSSPITIGDADSGKGCTKTGMGS